jgi:peptidoglycan hydrolase CwlO-like protein
MAASWRATYNSSTTNKAVAAEPLNDELIAAWSDVHEVIPEYPTVAPHVQQLQTRIDELDTGKFKPLLTTVDALQKQMRHLSMRMSDIENKHEQITSNVGDIQRDVSTINNHMKHVAQHIKVTTVAFVSGAVALLYQMTRTS